MRAAMTATWAQGGKVLYVEVHGEHRQPIRPQTPHMLSRSTLALTLDN